MLAYSQAFKVQIEFVYFCYHLHAWNSKNSQSKLKITLTYLKNWNLAIRFFYDVALRDFDQTVLAHGLFFQVVSDSVYHLHLFEFGSTPPIALVLVIHSIL